MPSGGGAGDSNSFTPEMVKQLPDALRDIIVGAYNDALTPIFLYMVPLMLVATVALLFIKEKPLATTIERVAVAESVEIDGVTDNYLGTVDADLDAELDEVVATQTAAVGVIAAANSDDERQ
jgi:hypothetical protein